METVTGPSHTPPLVEVCGVEDLWDGEMASFRVHDVAILLVRLDGQIHAYDGRCPHQGAALAEGELSGAVLTCHAHHWQFDAATGAGINPRKSCLKRLHLEIVEGKIRVEGLSG
jgi:nitrite reductase/ring-hydroxylating ferredoxin subunit